MSSEGRPGAILAFAGTARLGLTDDLELDLALGTPLHCSADLRYAIVGADCLVNSAGKLNVTVELGGAGGADWVDTTYWNTHAGIALSSIVRHREPYMAFRMLGGKLTDGVDTNPNQKHCDVDEYTIHIGISKSSGNPEDHLIKIAPVLSGIELFYHNRPDYFADTESDRVEEIGITLIFESHDMKLRNKGPSNTRPQSSSCPSRARAL